MTRVATAKSVKEKAGNRCVYGDDRGVDPMKGSVGRGKEEEVGYSFSWALHGGQRIVSVNVNAWADTVA
eukprot:6203132-Pyramimonas_sp.AAC.1